MLDKIFVPSSMNHEAYETRMREYYQSLKKAGIGKIIFGDIFLEDLRVFRERLLDQCGLEAIFPLWKQESHLLAARFIKAGFKAVICSADAKYFVEPLTPSLYDKHFINSLPAEVDPCGENGEFHTFVFDGPIFNNPVLISTGQWVAKDYNYKITHPDGSIKPMVSRFWFQDLSRSII